MIADASGEGLLITNGESDIRYVNAAYLSLAGARDARGVPGVERLFSGPIADALTHTGQLAMLRRMPGIPMRGENYFVADISAGRVGREQSSPKRQFD